jgi:hypothetical protein
MRRDPQGSTVATTGNEKRPVISLPLGQSSRSGPDELQHLGNDAHGLLTAGVGTQPSGRHELVDVTHPFPQAVGGLPVEFESSADLFGGLGDLHLRLGRPVHHAAPPHLHLRYDFSLVRVADQPNAVDVDRPARYQIG